MRINNQVLSLALLLSLSRVGLGQTAPAPTREDSVKGQIWTATARRVWADEKAVAPVKKWSTGSDFKNWVFTQKPDKTELGVLFGAVLKRTGQAQPATPTQVAQAILAEISQRKANKTGALAKVNLQSLQVDLEPFVPAGSTTSAVAQAADSATPATAQPASAPRTVAEDQNPAPEGKLPPPIYTVQPAEPTYWGMSPGLAGAGLTILGAVLGFSLASTRRKNKHGHRRPHSTPAPVESETLSVMTSPEYRKLHKQNENLTKQVLQLTKQVAALQEQLADVPTKASAAVAPNAPAVAAHISDTSLAAAAAAAQASEMQLPVAVPPAASELSIEEMVGAQPAALQPAATRYGPVQESAFLEERKIVDSPLPQLALMLTVNPLNPDQASFTLNPNVDQARLIGDGLKRLQKFFDHDPPVGNRINMITAAAPGQLQRQADGWQVVQRARLNIS